MSNDQSNIQVAAEHYSFSYHSPARYYSYVEQMSLICAASPQSVIEIGIGSGFVTRELQAFGVSVHTVDIDPALRPECVANVERLPFRSSSCDVVSCCEVLEHLPFERVGPALVEIARVTRHCAIISVPSSSSVMHLEITRGWSNPQQKKWMFSGSPLRAPQPHIFDGQHYWEIGKKDYPVQRIISAMQDAGFQVAQNYRFHLNPYHHFFVLHKK